MDAILEGYEDTPELPDEDDPEFQHEIFESFRRRGLKPKDIKDANYAALYDKWLVNYVG